MLEQALEAQREVIKGYAVTTRHNQKRWKQAMQLCARTAGQEFGKEVVYRADNGD